MKWLRSTAIILLFLLAQVGATQTVEIHQIDVGVGDATLIKINNPGGQTKTILIDAGKTGASPTVISYLTSPTGGNLGAVPYLDYVISSQWMAADIGAARAYGKFVIHLIIGNETRIPELINDTFCIIEQDRIRVREIAKKIDEATRKHIDKKTKEVDLNLPAGYQHLGSAVLRFQEDTPYDKSVFVMMKFPDRTSLDEKSYMLLTDIWDELVQTFSTYGLIVRRADKKTYHEQLWENICVYIFGCRYGLAILEDTVAQELNPNVTLEYGFMKALNRNVGLLRDVNFKHDRADLTGKLAKTFEIDANGVLDKTSLNKAVQDWLLDMGIAPILQR